MALEIGSIYRKGDDPDFFAKIQGFETGPSSEGDRDIVLFELWDKEHPGWQGGASMPQALFEGLYSDGPVTGWDNGSVDSEYHYLDCSCIYCIPGA